MANDEERLIVLLEARIRDFEKNMQKASGTADKSYGRMRKDSRSATRQMEQDMQRSTSRINQMLASTSTKIGAYGKTLAGGLIGGIAVGGIAGIVRQIGDVAHGIAEIGDEARRAGVSAEAFQEWKFVAEQNRIGIDQMTDGLKELNLRADEFVQTGKGSAAEAFQRLGYSAEDLKKKLADPSALLLEIIGRLGKFEKAAQIRISDELFGGSAGERFVELLAQGEQGISDTIQRAHDLGVVLDDDVIQKAAELDRRFNEVANTVGTALKSAIVSAADSLQEFIDGFRAFEDQHNRTLTNKSVEIDRERLDLENQILALRQKQRDETGTYADYEKRLIGGQISALEDQRKALSEEGAKIEAILSSRQTSSMARTASREWTPPTPPPGGFGSSSGGSGKSKAERETERQTEATRRLIAELQEELSLVGASDEQKRASAILRHAGANATAEERAQIVSLNEAIYQNTKAQEEAARASEFFRDTLGDAFMDMIPAIETGNRALDQFLNTMIQAVAQAALLGSGPLGGMFGGVGLLSMLGFASGTPNTGGQRGEPRGIVHGQEAVIPLPAGGKVPVIIQGGDKSRTKPASTGGTSTVQIVLSPDLEARILNQAAGQSVQIVQASKAGTVKSATDAVQQRVYRQPSYLRS